MTESTRRFVFETLEAGRSVTRLGRYTDLALIGLITLNIIAVILETVPELRRGYGSWFAAFEAVSVIIFTVEYVLRVWSAVEHPGEKFRRPILGRLRFMCTPMALIDLIVILPFYLTFFVSIDLRVLRVIRLLRVARLTRYSTSMALLFHVLRDEARNIGAAVFVLLVLMTFGASILFLAEHRAQPEAFGSVPAALWWAAITMTTIGYGDVVPVTVMGRIFAGVLGIISVGMVALPAGILASGFNEALHRRRRRFETLADELLDEGPLDDDARSRLRELQVELGLSDTEAASFLKDRHRRHRQEAKPNTCPHCGEPL